MEYLASILGSIIAIVGIVGHTWNPKKKGLKKLTITGRITLICTLIVLVYSIFLISMNRNKKEEESITRQKYNDLANYELYLALTSIDDAFQSLYGSFLLSIGNKKDSIKAFESYNWPLSCEWNDSTRQFLDYLSYINMLESPKIWYEGSDVLYNETWAHYLNRKFKIAKANLELVNIAYVNYLSKEDIIAINQLRDCRLLSYVSELKDVYYNKEIEPYFPVLDTPELCYCYKNLRNRLIEKDSTYKRLLIYN